MEKKETVKTIPFLLVVLLMTFIVLPGHGQRHHDLDSMIQSHRTIISDDSLISRTLHFWKPIVDETCQRAGIVPFDSISTAFHFRLYNTSQIVDIHEHSPTQFYGALFQWALEAVPNGEAPTNRVYCLQRPLTDYQITAILELYHSSGMDTLRPQEKIKGWDNGLDGVTYIVESMRNKVYQFRAYWSPHLTSTISEERLVSKFVDSCFSLAGSKILSDTFHDSNPFYSSENGTGSVATRIVTWEKYQQMKRERKRYRKAVRRKSISNEVIK